MFKVNLHHSIIIIICYRNTSLLKHGFRVKACWWLKKMLKVSTLPFHAANAGDRLLEPSFLPPVWLGLFTTISHELASRAVTRCRSADWDSVMVHAWWCSVTFSSRCLGILEECVSGACVARGGPTAWPACSSDCNTLHFDIWGHLKTIVCATDVSEVQDLWRTQYGFEVIRKRAGVLGRVWHSLFRRATSCTGTQRGHFENLL